jgi:dephospho-CoA kinase
VGKDGYIDRQVLGGRVFGKPDEMKRLTAAIGSITPAIKQVVDDWRATLPRGSIAVLEAVNMIEPGYSGWIDQTWLVASTTDEMRRRLTARNQLNAAQVEQRLASQRPWEERAAAADAVFYNDGSLADLAASVRDEFERAVSLYRQGRLPESRWLAWGREHGVQVPA